MKNAQSNHNTIPEMLTTEDAAAALHKKPQSLRVWSCTGSGPIQPVRLGKRGRLLWRKSDIIAILSGEADAFNNASVSTRNSKNGGLEGTHEAIETN